ncbi:S49 family peptidase [Agarilytica rhodophyticola]|uniref:S49 family peptidase n=1 Tax=Agarilytica rhodophyticola TaxID=1737490 RepID=UPI000B346300|nr:S49 family peptidase [Agarilytica rhodophyticola]
MKFWNRASHEAWAISTHVLETIIELAAQHNTSPEAIAAKMGKALDNTYRVTERDGVAVLPITGPLFRYSNFFTSFFGASSYERIAHDFMQALHNPDITSIVFDFDSPGGEVNGCSELANLIFESRGTKPIIAYASGDCASGAYWIASACDRIVVSDTAQLGSIGVVAVYHNSKGKDAEIEIVSSQSPFKRIDPSHDKGREKIQARIDALADVFINSIAQHRNVSADTVTNDYGQGDVLIGQAAIERGLADSGGTYEKLLHELTTSTLPSPSSSQPQSQPLSTRPESPDFFISEDNTLDIDTLKKDHFTLYQQVLVKGITQERQRIHDILEDDEAKEKTALAQHLALNTDLSHKIVISTLQQIPITPIKEDSTPPKNTPEASSGFSEMMATIDNPKIVPKADESSEEENTDDVARRIAQYSLAPVSSASGGDR